jgi:chromosome segregation ATPase
LISPEDQIKVLQSQIQALEIQLTFKSETITKLSEQLESVQSNLRDVTDKYESQGQMTKDLTKDMTRQYKGMQDDLLNKINERERIIESLRESLQCQKRDFNSSLELKDSDLEDKRQVIDHLRIKIEDICSQFAHMLSSVVTNIKEKIGNQPELHREQSTPIRCKMEEIQFDL